MAEWRTIPGWEAYEISSSGTVRRIATRYRMRRCGPSVRMWDGAHALYLPVDELLAKAFPGGGCRPDATPDPDALVWLRRRVAELEEEVATLRAAAQTSKPAKAAQRKRYCVVCGRLLPPGYWRRCPEHALGEDGLSEDDFRGAVIR